jgi:DNA-binding GntR family transcriptional regulator
MRQDIAAGPLTPAELRGMLEKNLAERYGVSRDTVRKARVAVLSEMAEPNSRQIPTIDK